LLSQGLSKGLIGHSLEEKG
jgi:hypothetical protein